MDVGTLISINGLYGCGAYGKPENRNLQDLLNRMDRFGIAASVTCHTEAKDLDPLYGNRKLMADIEATPGAQGRIIPAFVITPAMFYQPEAYGYVMRHLEQGCIRAVALYPKTSRFVVREIEKVLRSMEPYRPAVLMDAWEMAGDGDYRDLQDVALALPSLTFIVRQAMWWQFSVLADLMARCNNVRLDISQLHIRDIISMVTANFGPKRLVFGLGPASHGGAALAALRWASIDEKCRERIAHGNLEAVLGLPAGYIKPVAAIANNALWERFMRGEGIPPEIHVIDAHSHISPPGRGWYVPHVAIRDQIGVLDCDLARFGVDQIISCPFAQPLEGNSKVEEAVAGYGAPKGRFLGYLVYNPFYAGGLSDSVLDEYFDRDYFVGFKIIPEYWRVSMLDPVFEAMWRYADRHALPILIHTWEGTYGTAGMIGEIAPRYPNAVFLVGHAGGGDEGRREAEELARVFDNVYLEWCGSFTANTRWEETITRVGAHKVVYGTDTFFHDIAWELGRLLCLNLTWREFKMILGANMAGILDRRRT